MRIHLFVPCFIDQVATGVAWATVRILERLGHEIVVPENQTCCGQPALNSGFHEEGVDVAATWLNAFADAEQVVAPSGSCVALVRNHFPDLFVGSDYEREAQRLAGCTHELSEFLVDVLGVEDLGASYSGRATYHDGCHGLRDLGVGRQARALLRKVRGLELVEMDREDLCCGFGGSFAVKLPELSVSMADTKLASIEATEADLLVSGEATCLMHLEGRLTRQGKSLRVMHLAELLCGDSRELPS